MYLDTVALVNDQVAFLLKEDALVVHWIHLWILIPTAALNGLDSFWTLLNTHDVQRPSHRPCQIVVSRFVALAFTHTHHAELSCLTDTFGLYHSSNTVQYTLQILHQSPHQKIAPMVC